METKFSEFSTAVQNLKYAVESSYNDFSSYQTADLCCKATGMEHNDAFKAQVGLTSNISVNIF